MWLYPSITHSRHGYGPIHMGIHFAPKASSFPLFPRPDRSCCLGIRNLQGTRSPLYLALRECSLPHFSCVRSHDRKIKRTGSRSFFPLPGKNDLTPSAKFTGTSRIVYEKAVSPSLLFEFLFMVPFYPELAINSSWENSRAQVPLMTTLTGSCRKLLIDGVRNENRHPEISCCMAPCPGNFLRKVGNRCLVGPGTVPAGPVTESCAVRCRAGSRLRNRSLAERPETAGERPHSSPEPGHEKYRPENQ